MDANQAVINVGAVLNKARDYGLGRGRLVARDKEIIFIAFGPDREGDIPINHLSSKDLWHGPSSAKWNHIEDRIRDLILEGVL